MSLRYLTIASLLAVSATVAGCADTQSLFGGPTSLTTSAVAPPAAPKADPACAGLAAQIETLRKDAAAAKVETASQKKAKVSLTAAETAKVDQLQKANVEFQAKCSTYKPGNVAVAPASAPAGAGAVVARRQRACPGTNANEPG